MVAVEIDGSQRLKKERKAKDEEKDKLLISKGWKVIRFMASDVMYKKLFVLEKLQSFLKTGKKYEKVGILKYVSNKRIKKERGEDGFADKERESFYKQRKVKNRPSKNELLNEIKESSFAKVGRKYGVSDNTIRKWRKNYKLPFRTKEIKKYNLADSSNG